MKISLALSALILAIGASLSWRDEQRFAVARNNHTHLVAKAATLGITADPARPSSHGRITKHGRPGKEGEVDALVADTIAFFKKNRGQWRNVRIFSDASCVRPKRAPSGTPPERCKS